MMRGERGLGEGEIIRGEGEGVEEGEYPVDIPRLYKLELGVSDTPKYIYNFYIYCYSLVLVNTTLVLVNTTLVLVNRK